MSIKTKITGLVILSLLIFSLISYLIQLLIMEQSFSSMEIDFAKKEMVKTITVLNEQKKYISTMAADYAAWDDTYNYIFSGNPKYLFDNYNDMTINNLKLSVFAIFDARSNFRYGKMKDARTGWKEIGGLGAGGDFNPAAFLAKGSSGIMRIAGRLCLVSVQPIVRSDRSGNPNGVLLFGAFLADVIGEDVRKILDVDFKITDYRRLDAEDRSGINDVFLNADKNTVFFTINNIRAAARIGDSSVIDVYAILRDMFDREAALVSVSTGRSINRAWLGSQFDIWRLGALVTVIIILAVHLYFSRLITGPLVRLSRSLESFDPETSGPGDGDREAAAAGASDEIGQLARSFSRMKNNIIDNHRKIKQLNETLEARVAERTRELEEANHELGLSDQILRETTEGVCITDMSGTLLKVNDAFCAIAGYAPEELIGQNPRIMKSDHHDAEFYRQMWHDITEKGYWSGEVWDRKKTGEVYPKWLSINTIRNNAGVPTNYIGISSDITKVKDAEEHIKKLAYYDSLTGLPNRSLFGEILERAILRAEKYGKLIVMMYLDLDRFKNVNDSLGHSVGDQVLVEVAKRLQRIVKKSDTIARLGGDEFAILMEEIEISQELIVIAERVIRDISRPYLINGREISIGTSIGIAIAPTDDATVEGLLMKADSTMYYSKESGRGRFTFFSREIQQRNEVFIRTENMINKAIGNNEFRLVLQPKILVDGDTREICGAEALIRIAPEGGPVIMPDTFIKIAEDTGLIIPIGTWVIEEACRQIAFLRKQNIDIHVAVNASARQFENFDIYDIIENAIKSNGISPGDLEVEITESIFYGNIKTIRTIIGEIRRLGVKIGIDDFGTGYSSLAALARLPIDYLKIDKSFVDELGGANKKELVTSIISISRNLDLAAIVEGVETQEQFDLLSSYAPIVMQGYYFSKPLDRDDFVEYCVKFNHGNRRAHPA